MDLRRFNFRLLLCALLIAGTGGAFGADDLPPGLDRSVSRGLDFLAAQQNPDGSFGTAQKPAMTGLSLMSFLACGHTPSAGKLDSNGGKYGSNVRGAIDFLLGQAQPDGTFGHNEKPMYGQAIATLALAEAYGVDDSEPQRKRIATALTNSVKLILTAQDVHKQEVYAGGWRYEANSPDSDLSLSGWNALALRACQDVGIAVPRSAVQKATKFVMKCFSAEGKGFAYQPGSAVSPSMNSAGLVCLHLLEGGQSHEAAVAAQTLASRPVDESSPYQYYSAYYATQAAFQVGDRTWREVSKVMFAKLMSAQQPDGGWPDNGAESFGTGRVYASSMAVLTLAIPYRLLPVYQR